MRHALLLFAFGWLLSGCSSASATRDAASLDASALDAAALDAAALDAAALDAAGAPSDGGGMDSGSPDGGRAVCAPACGGHQVCVHASWCSGAAIDCPNSPPPFCADVPAGCGAAPSCTCFPGNVCHTPNDAGLSGGQCSTVAGQDLECSNA